MHGTWEHLGRRNGKETVRGHMEVKSTKRRCDCDADGVVDLLVGGLVESTSGALEAMFQREGGAKGVG